MKNTAPLLPLAVAAAIAAASCGVPTGDGTYEPLPIEDISPDLAAPSTVTSTTTTSSTVPDATVTTSVTTTTMVPETFETVEI
ncbi:MAG: hypothetical protein AAFP84_15400, partial [Actinomycetota bacterium]